MYYNVFWSVGSLEINVMWSVYDLSDISVFKGKHLEGLVAGRTVRPMEGGFVRWCRRHVRVHTKKKPVIMMGETLHIYCE